MEHPCVERGVSTGTAPPWAAGMPRMAQDFRHFTGAVPCGSSHANKHEAPLTSDAGATLR